MAINLSKGRKINLEKKSSKSGLGQILINLNWNSTPVNQGFFKNILGLGKKGIDLDLGCFYKLKNGDKGVIQALGNSFGDLTKEPYIFLDGDDRTGTSADGENLLINGDKVQYIEKILIFTYIYEGVANWKQADGVVTIKYPGAEDIIVKMDEYDDTNKMCALAVLENVNDDTFSVEKLVRFYKDHKAMDRAFGWNFNWTYGKK